MRAVSTSALVRRTLHPLMIPRKSLAEPVTAGSSSAFSADHGGISPVVPRSRKQASMAPLLFCPAGLEEAGMQGRGALFVGLRWLRLLRWQAKGYQVEVLLAEFRLCGWWGLPVSAWEALASYWSRVLGAVCPEGRYRIPFKDSPPSLACTPLSFPTYQAGSPRSLALRQAAEQMLSRDTLDIIFDPSSGFSSCLFLVGKVTVSWRLVFDLSYLNEFVLQPPFMMGTVASVLPRGGFPSFHCPNWCVFQNTRSSGIKEAFVVPVGWGSLPVRGPVPWGVNYPSSLPQGVCRGLYMGSVPRDFAFRVPERLAGPRLLGGRGQKQTFRICSGFVTPSGSC